VVVVDERGFVKIAVVPEKNKMYLYYNNASQCGVHGDTSGSARFL